MIPARTLFARLSALSLAVLLFLFGGAGGAFDLHECDHHDALPGQDTTPAPHEGHGSGPSDESPHEGPCTCIGTCHASAAAPLPSDSGTATLRRATAPRRAATPSQAESLRLSLLPYFHPYANPPPILG